MQDTLSSEQRLARKRIEELTQEKNGAYTERNALVALLTKLFPSHMMHHEESDLQWEDDWRNIVCVVLPTGQACWHIHDSEVKLFNHLQHKDNNWDGHTTEEKYQRIDRYSPIEYEGEV